MRRKTSSLRHGSSSSTAGFILPDALAAIAIITMIVIVLVGSLSLASRSRQAAAMDITRLDTGFTLMALTELVSGALPLMARGDDGRASVAFFGDEKLVSFVVLSEARQLRGGYSWISIDNHIGKTPLSVRSGVFRGVINGNGNNDIIISHLLDLRIMYYGSKDGLPPDWHSSWSKQLRLPEQVKLIIVDEQGKTTIEMTALLGRDRRSRDDVP